jgi:membrane protease YdiL (CAAX protease family)
MSGNEQVEPGWYDDPFGDQPFRWWDGAIWTPATASSRDEPVPEITSARRIALLPPLPFRAAGWALLAIVASAVLGGGVAIGARALGAPGAIVVATSQIALWTPMVGACLYVSRRLGTGNPRVDFGVEFHWRDVLRGLGVWFVAILTVGFVLQFLPETVRRHGAGNTEIARHFRHDTAGIAVVLIIGIVGAPLIEELFFRGLLLRSLVDRLPRGVAVVLQATVFGLLHASPVRGISNVNVVVATGTLGVVFGFAAAHYRRLGPGMVAHATQNTLALMVVVLTR